MSRQC